jgi:hypothetical protein
LWGSCPVPRYEGRRGVTKRQRRRATETVGNWPPLMIKPRGVHDGNENSPRFRISSNKRVVGRIKDNKTGRMKFRSDGIRRPFFDSHRVRGRLISECARGLVCRPTAWPSRPDPIRLPKDRRDTPPTPRAPRVNRGADGLPGWLIPPEPQRKRLKIGIRAPAGSTEFHETRRKSLEIGTETQFKKLS